MVARVQAHARGFAIAIVAAVIVTAIATDGAYGSGGAGRAHVARTIDATVTAHLHYISASGSQLLEEGTVSGGPLPGRMRVRMNIGPTLSASFTLTTKGGSIKGRGTAKLHGAGAVESFSGTLTANGGTGRFAGASGHAGLYGTFNRKSYALVVQTAGRLSY